MPIDTNTLLIIFAGVLLVVLVLVLHLEYKLKRLVRGKSGADLEALIVQNANDLEKLKLFRKELQTYLEGVEKRLDESVRGVGTIRFNPFKGTGDGGNMSFASAFVNAEGDGVVLSTLQVRERMSVFAKPLKEFKSEFELTGEEKEAIHQAQEKLHR